MISNFATIKLFTNGKINPLGLDFNTLRLSVEVDVNGKIDYVVFRLYNSLSELKKRKFFFETQSKNLFVAINATDYQTAQRVYWTAKIVVDGQEYLSDIAYFEMGLRILKEEELWIENPKFEKYVSEFNKTFSLTELPEFARLYIVGLGYYQSKINEKQTDGCFFKPLLTDFDYRKNNGNIDYDEDNFYNDKKRISYDTFDVTNLLRLGENRLTVLLGTGWYCNEDKLITVFSDSFGKPKLFFQLHLHYKDSVKIIKSDESVLVRNTARVSQLYIGDRCDFTAFNEEFINARICPTPAGKLVFPECEHDAVIQEISPLYKTVENGIIEYDFGINHSGSVAMKVIGERGKKLTLRYYEVKTDGKLNPYTSEWIAYDVTGESPVAIDVVYQKDEYILSGKEDEIFPLFHFNCYRYLTVACEGKCEISEIKSLYIATNVKKDGEFTCSDALIDKYYNAFVITQRNNMHSGIPSDCPHREKLPYACDGDLACEPTLYTFRSEQFYRKWLQDILDAQGNNGWVPYTAPYISGAGGYWWSNVITSLPLKLYAFTGDRTLIEKTFPAVLSYIDFCNGIHSGDFIIRKSFIRWNLGEWLTPGPTTIDVDFMNTLAYYVSVDNALKMCSILKEENKKQELTDLKEKIKTAINTHFYNKEKKCYANGEQGADILPLFYGFLEGDEYETVRGKLIAKYRKTKKFDTGIILTPALLEALTKWGETELCYQLFVTEETPSFRYMLEGETTLCEHWTKKWWGDMRESGELVGADVSHCHPMFGSVVSWMYKHIAGLDLSELYNNKVLVFPKFVKQIKSASASKETNYGKVAVSYNAEHCFQMQIVVPYGLTCFVIINQDLTEDLTVNGEKYRAVTLKDGKYLFTLEGGEYLIT